ncbi:MAG TPA: 4Fe-4S ferredoxin [Candidatus Deferrimicrobiaceae bacterium]|nr:4Fe-4S ferredoxin [Candidatus Deferrimicrobiaceae bacterium]
MAYPITEDCIASGACAPECPEQCITEGERIYLIDGSRSSGCASCAGVCPTAACVSASPL